MTSVASAFRALSDGVILQWGWRRLAIALAAGAASVLAIPPIGAFPIMALTLPMLVWLIDGAAGRDRFGIAGLGTAFLIGWFFGFGYFLGGLWWVGVAFLVEAKVFGWLLPIGVAGLPAGLALFTGLGTALARLAWSRSPWRVAALAGGLGLTEYLRGTILTGFPWNAFGYALAANDVQMQAASLLGLHALTVLALFIGAAPAILAEPPGIRRLSRRLVLGLAAVLFLGQLAFGAARLALATDDVVSGVGLRLVQPNFTQDERLDPSKHLEVFERYLRLSSGASTNPSVPRITHIIWPESALPYRATKAEGVLSRITGMLSPGQVLIAGFLRGDETNPGKVFNSLYVFDEHAGLLDRYDKTHLVPFGEYLPFPETMSLLGLEPLTRIFAFVPGLRRVPIRAGAGPSFVPLICYEVIFPEGVTGDTERPGYLVNISDDSWFGDTMGPLQHFHQARLRAVEQGLPLIRVTATGISGVVDPYGRVRASLAVGAQGTIDTGLPASISPTFFALWGRWIVWVVLAATWIPALFARFGFIDRYK